MPYKTILEDEAPNYMDVQHETNPSPQQGRGKP